MGGFGTTLLTLDITKILELVNLFPKCIGYLAISYPELPRYVCLFKPTLSLRTAAHAPASEWRESLRLMSQENLKTSSAQKWQDQVPGGRHDLHVILSTTQQQKAKESWKFYISLAAGFVLRGWGKMPHFVAVLKQPQTTLENRVIT